MADKEYVGCMPVEFAALLISAAAFVLSSWAAWNSHRQTNESRRQADAAEDQITMMREERATADAQQEALDARPWRLSHYKGDTYELINIGSQTAYDISVAGGTRAQWYEAPENDQLTSGESATIIVAISLGSPSRKVTVRWATEPGGEQKEMQLLLPPK